MVFNSYEFVLMFFPVFIIGFYIIRGLNRKKNNRETLLYLWIILASLAFYCLFGVMSAAVCGISIFWNICTSIPMSFMRDRNVKVSLFGKEIYPQKLWLFIGVCGNLVLLLFFKLWGGAIPIAISFYTFNQISYIVDLYRGEIKSFELIEYLSYVLFFPKLLQGPLMGYGDYKREITKAFDGVKDYETIMRGLYLFSVGLFKKVILADTFGKAVYFAYQGVGGLGSLEAVLTAIFYSFQLYFDFSGYCDMAGGICMLLGFELPMNFDSPYKAVDIMDFWKRWHITLTRFFTRYVYIPLGGNRKGAARMYANFMIVFLLSGFWHGTGVTFIIWGAMHGVAYVITRFIHEKRNSNSEEKDNAFLHLIKVALTFCYVTIAWIFFRAESVSDAAMLIKRMFVGGHKAIATGISSCFQLDELWYVIKVTPLMKLSFAWDICLWLFLAVSVFMIFFCNNAIRKAKTIRIGLGTTLLTAVLLLWSIVSLGGVSTYIYMNF